MAKDGEGPFLTDSLNMLSSTSQKLSWHETQKGGGVWGISVRMKSKGKHAGGKTMPRTVLTQGSQSHINIYNILHNELSSVSFVQTKLTKI